MPKIFFGKIFVIIFAGWQRSFFVKGKIIFVSNNFIQRLKWHQTKILGKENFYCGPWKSRSSFKWSELQIIDFLFPEPFQIAKSLETGNFFLGENLTIFNSRLQSFCLFCSLKKSRHFIVLARKTLQNKFFLRWIWKVNESSSKEKNEL